MMLKKKKPGEQGHHGHHGPAVAEVPLQPDVFLDSLVRVVGNFGFQQILLSPLEERKIYAKHPQLVRRYSEEMAELAEGTGAGTVMSPTYMFGVLKRYLGNFKQRGPHVSKWFHISPVIRISAGKPVIFHELGIYVLGEDSSMAAAQLINTVAEILRELGVSEFVTELNSLGCRSCQKNYKEAFENHISAGLRDLCADCRENFEIRPVSMWSCRNAVCQEIFSAGPQIVDSLDEACKTNLMGVLEHIDELSIPYTLNPILHVPLLEEKVAFRIIAQAGSENVVGFGGNYSSWMSHVGAVEPVAVLGFQTSFERLWQAVPEERRRTGPKVEVFMVPLGAIASRRALALHRDLQHSGILSAEAMLGNASIKNQLKEAVEKHCEIALIIGQKEALDETVILRDMRSGMQELFAADRIIEEVKKRLGK